MQLLLLLAAFVSFPIAGDVGDSSISADLHPQPPALQFENAAARLAFGEGFDRFISGEWGAAKEAFGTAMKAVCKEDKKTLKGFFDATKLGPKFDKVLEDIGRGKYPKSYRKLLDWEAKYGSGPFAHHLTVGFAQLDSTFFQVLANYEKNPEKDKKDDTPEGKMKRALEDLTRGKGEICNDPAFVRRGERSLKWLARPAKKNAFVSLDAHSLARFEDGEVLARHRYLLISLHPGDARDVEVQLSFDDADDPRVRVRSGGSLTRYDLQRATLRPGQWNDLRIDLWNPKVRKAVKWSEVYGFRIRLVHPDEKRTIYIDEVKLEKA